MITLDQVKLLETKVTKAIDYVKKVTEENSLLKGKLDSYQKRIDELEIMIQQFKEDQSRIEDGILAALDRLNQFEDAVESKLAAGGEAPAPQREAEGRSPPPEKKPGPVKSPPPPKPSPKPEPAPEPEPADEDEDPDPAGSDSGELDIF
jgi:FtsZ-binding cell division protein ZapB